MNYFKQIQSKAFNLALVLVAGLTGAVAHSGSATSGGGGTQVCLNPDGSIKSVEMYDLYEGREARRFHLIDPGAKTANELLNDAVEKIYVTDPQYAKRVINKLAEYSSNKAVVKNKHLQIITDANLVFLDAGCQFVQIAQWRDEYRAVFIDADLYKSFSNSQLNIAALALHEAIYAVERQTKNIDNSDYARKLVAEAFSDEQFEGKQAGTVVKGDKDANYVLEVSAIRNGAILESTVESWDTDKLYKNPMIKSLDVSVQGWRASTRAFSLNSGVVNAYVIGSIGTGDSYDNRKLLSDNHLRIKDVAKPATFQCRILANGKLVYSEDVSLNPGRVPYDFKSCGTLIVVPYENYEKPFILALKI